MLARRWPNAQALFRAGGCCAPIAVGALATPRDPFDPRCSRARGASWPPNRCRWSRPRATRRHGCRAGRPRTEKFIRESAVIGFAARSQRTRALAALIRPSTAVGIVEYRRCASSSLAPPEVVQAGAVDPSMCSTIRIFAPKLLWTDARAQTLRDICACRTAALGAHLYQCDGCQWETKAGLRAIGC